MQIPFVGFQPVRTSEHMAAAGKYHFSRILELTRMVRGCLNLDDGLFAHVFVGDT